MSGFERVAQDPWQGQLLVRCNCGGSKCGTELARVYRDGDTFVFRGKGRGLLLNNGRVKTINGVRLSSSQPVPLLGATPGRTRSIPRETPGTTARERQAKISASSQHVVAVSAPLLGDFVYEVACERHGDRRVTGGEVAEAARRATRVGHSVRDAIRMFSMTLPGSGALNEGGSTTP
jgi:hypothetical protein